MSTACAVPRVAAAAGRRQPACRASVPPTWAAPQHGAAPTSACSAPVRAQRLAVVTAAKRGGGGGGGGGAQRKQKKSQRSEAEQFEQLMTDWDDAFAADCADPETAAQLAGLAEEGYRKHGRGFVFVQSRLERRSRKAVSGAGGGKGFGAAAVKQQAEPEGAPLPNNPQLALHEWSAVYIPGPLLGGVGGVFSAAGEGASLSLLPDNTALLAQEGGDGGSSGAATPSSTAPPAAGAGAAAAEDAAAVDDLRRVLRGQDLSQLYAYIGLPPPGSEGGSEGGSSGSGEAGSSAEQQQEQQQQQQPAGIRAYEPEAGELVVLLAARIGGKPATGAELLAAVRQPDGSTRLELPDGWEALLAGA